MEDTSLELGIHAAKEWLKENNLILKKQLNHLDSCQLYAVDHECETICLVESATSIGTKEQIERRDKVHQWRNKKSPKTRWVAIFIPKVSGESNLTPTHLYDQIITYPKPKFRAAYK